MSYKEWTYGDLCERCRKEYFKERDKQRNHEIKELIRDVEFLMSEIKRLERRTKEPNLLAPTLRNLFFRLYYMEERPNRKTDRELVLELADKYCIHENFVYNILFSNEIFESWWLTETESGKEIDFFIPEGATMQLPRRPMVSQHLIQNTRKEDIVEILLVLDEENKRLKRTLRKWKRNK